MSHVTEYQARGWWSWCHVTSRKEYHWCVCTQLQTHTHTHTHTTLEHHSDRFPLGSVIEGASCHWGGGRGQAVRKTGEAPVTVRKWGAKGRMGATNGQRETRTSPCGTERDLHTTRGGQREKSGGKVQEDIIKTIERGVGSGTV